MNNLLLSMQQHLPIHLVLPELRAALAKYRITVLSAPPGSGKTTLTPLALLNETWLTGQKILILEPRRLAARLAAERMATLLGQQVGETVGYQIRFDRKITPTTRIEVLTEGILTRRLQNDPLLDGIGLVIFDEFHERSIHTDLTLALCLDVQAGLREELRLLIMSATLDTLRLTELLNDAALVIAEGRAYPIEIRYLDYSRKLPAGKTIGSGYDVRQTVSATAAAIRQAATEANGDILAFLPGSREIQATAAQLTAWAKEQDIRIDPLYADLPKNKQLRAVQSQDRDCRRVVLATSIAETSLTIEGIGIVVDSGWTRVPRFDTNRGLTRLVTVRISQSAAVQRAGRAGRLGPGVCYRLMPMTIFPTLLSQPPPEILNADLTPLLLDLLHWGINDPGKLFWLDPPPSTNLAQARETLARLNAVDDRVGLTDLGRQLAQLPLHPRLGRLLLFAAAHGQLAIGADLAALLSERDIMFNASVRPTDIELRLKALSAFRNRDTGTLTRLGADPAACTRVDRASRQFRQLLHDDDQKTGDATGYAHLLALAYPERVAQLRPGSKNRYLLASGRGAHLPEGDGLCATPYLVAPELDAGTIEGRIFLATGVEIDSLREACSQHITTTDKIFWDEDTETVAARTEELFFKLTLSSTTLTKPDHEAIRQAMLDGIRRLGLTALPWTREADEFKARVLSMHCWQPAAGWPDLKDSALLTTLADWLGPHIDNIASRRDLQKINLFATLRSLLSWQMLERLAQEAPTHITAPSGSRLRLSYTPGQPPVLAVRLQEMFGLADTPRICQDRIPVLLHLLSPARRPIQITQDLNGFWNTTYRQVRKELMGRYPKHHWPEDPWTAIPTARAKKAGKILPGRPK